MSVLIMLPLEVPIVSTLRGYMFRRNSSPVIVPDFYMTVISHYGRIKKNYLRETLTNGLHDFPK
jgi:hypothetical protein